MTLIGMYCRLWMITWVRVGRTNIKLRMLLILCISLLAKYAVAYYDPNSPGSAHMVMDPTPFDVSRAQNKAYEEHSAASWARSGVERSEHLNNAWRAEEDARILRDQMDENNRREQKRWREQQEEEWMRRQQEENNNRRRQQEEEEGQEEDDEEEMFQYEEDQGGCLPVTKKSTDKYSKFYEMRMAPFRSSCAAVRIHIAQDVERMIRNWRSSERRSAEYRRAEEFHEARVARARARLEKMRQQEENEGCSEEVSVRKKAPTIEERRAAAGMNPDGSIKIKRSGHPDSCERMRRREGGGWIFFY